VEIVEIVVIVEIVETVERSTTRLFTRQAALATLMSLHLDRWVGGQHLAQALAV
jgi:hypothetical protein